MKKYNAVLFDLDGTLIPFEQEEFIQRYFKELLCKMVPLGYDKDNLVKAVWAGTNAMLSNCGLKTNKEAFFEVFYAIIQRGINDIEPLFYEFYTNEFDRVKDILKYKTDRSGFINSLKEKGVGVILATNPVFPREAVETRLSWIGLKGSDFQYITTYENSHYSKPDRNYYNEILRKTGHKASECIMIGNNTSDDMQAALAGLEVYLVTDNLENQSGEDIAAYNHGSFEDMSEMLLGLYQ